LQIHGDADDIVAYDGGVLPIPGTPAAFPGARTTVERWAKLDACASEPQHAALAEGVDVDRWSGCRTAAEVELRTVRGAGHSLPLGRAQGEAVWSFLAKHAKSP
jgi:polyhydroxybutyrate depolymerase